MADYGNLYFDFNADQLTYRFQRHRRMKILTRAGFDRADVVIPVYTGSDRISKMKAQTILPDGSTIEAKKKDIFEEKVTDDLVR